MTDRLEARSRFHKRCNRHGWPTTCDACGSGLEDPENSDYDAFCDFCCCYYNFGRWDALPAIRPTDVGGN